jgi:hypothetical protein
MGYLLVVVEKGVLRIYIQMQNHEKEEKQVVFHEQKIGIGKIINL